jgi:prolyl oligopeptidase
MVLTIDRPLPTLQAPDNDPWLWLEDLESENSLQWVNKQNARTLAQYQSLELKDNQTALTLITDQPNKIPYITRRGGKLYNFWTDVNHVRGLWRRTILESYQTDTPEWEVIVDFDVLADAKGED